MDEFKQAPVENPPVTPSPEQTSPADVLVPEVPPAPNLIFCANCDTLLSAGQAFCPKCGLRVGETPGKSNTKKKKIIAIIGAIVVLATLVATIFIVRGTQAKSVTLNKESLTVKVGELFPLTCIVAPEDTKDKTVTWSSSNDSIARVDDGAVIGINEGDCTITVSTKNGKTDTCAVLVTSAGPDLLAIYDAHCSASFAEVANDGSYLSIDTNSLDIDDYVDFEALQAIEDVNEALGLPESVINRMKQTRALDGFQSYETDELDISWTYHPDKGLNVSYALK